MENATSELPPTLPLMRVFEMNQPPLFFFFQLMAGNAAAATGPYVTFMERLASNGLEKQT